MNPAIQYLTRTNLIRSWFDTPCSIFLENLNSQIIVTINKGKDSGSLRVKNWFLVNCDKEFILPPFKESIILEKDLFSHPNTIIAGYKTLLGYTQTIPSYYHKINSPIPEELYIFFFNNIINGVIYQKLRKTWLWKKFTLIYLPEFYLLQTYIPKHELESDFVENQMEIVRYNFQKIWQTWKKWENYFLLPMPGEFIFGKEYGSL
jgi:hypothetical protein